jgi:hypothetical protein
MHWKTMAALERIVDLPEGELCLAATTQASLGISSGGMGLTDSRDTADVAYAGSIALCLAALVQLEENCWSEELGLAGTFSGLAPAVEKGDVLGDYLEPAQRSMVVALFHAKSAYEKAQKHTEELKVFYMKGKTTVQGKGKAKGMATRGAKGRGGPVQVAPPPKEEQFAFPTMKELSMKSMPQLQKRLTQALSKTRFHRLMVDNGDGLVNITLSDEGKRRLLSASGPGAGAWLTALPTRGDFRTSSANFVHAVRLRLGIVPACMEDLRDQSMVCECGQWHDPAHPAQMMCCPKAGGGCVWFRHNVVRDTVAKEAKAVGYSVLVEEVTVNGQSGQHLRTDVSILDYGRKKAHLDFAVTDPTRRSVKRVVQGAAATETANRKIRESKEKFPDLDPYDDVFVPAIMETYGLMHTDLRKVLRTLAEKRLSKSGMDTSFSTEEQSILLGSVMNSLYQKVSVAAMRGIVVSMRRAADKIKAYNARGLGGSLVSNARAEEMVGAALRQARSGLSEMMG